MKIIDLLNRIAKGEEVPKKFRYDNNIFVYDKEDKDYVYSNGNVSFFTDYFTDIYHLEDVLMILNDEVEVIEEKEISIYNIDNMKIAGEKAGEVYRRLYEGFKKGWNAPIEEEKEIENIPFDNEMPLTMMEMYHQLEKYNYKINQIIDVMNDMRDKE